jgi:hypothetical protein
MNLTDRETLNSDNPFIRDQAMNQVAKDFFAMQHPQEVKDLMLFGLISLLLDKSIISEEELTKKVEEATQFYKILKRRSEKSLDIPVA